MPVATESLSDTLDKFSHKFVSTSHMWHNKSPDLSAATKKD